MEHDNRKRKALILLFLILSLTVYPVIATTIFSDGFETGNFSAWTGTAGTPEVVNTGTPHHGTYHMKVNANTEGAYKTVAEQTTIYVRAYAKFTGTPATYTTFFTAFMIRKGSTIVAFVSFRQVGAGTYVIELYRYYPASVAAYSAAFGFTTDTYYCLELKFVRSATVGEYRVYRDGSEVITVTGLDTSGVTGIDRVDAANYWCRGTNPVGYVDCVVVADAYIGLEVSGQDLTFQLSQTITLTSSSSMFKEKGFSLSQTVILTSSLTENKAKRFSFSEIAHLTSSLIQRKELGFPLSVTIKTTSTLTMNKETLVVIHEWLYGLQETAHLTSNLYTDLEIAEKVSLGLGFYIGVLALVIALMAYLRSRH